MFGKNAKEAMIREDLECLRDIGEVLVIIVRRVKLKLEDRKKADVEKTLPDVYSDSLDSGEEFLRIVKSSITTLPSILFASMLHRVFSSTCSRGR